MPCYHPIKLQHLETKVPCSRCIGCRLERSCQWAVRCVHESQMHEKNCFVTLTYSDTNLPWGVERGTLYPRHLQLFIKRLRKKYGSGIRFFACGEYGDSTSRPHYHACIFGHDFEDKKLFSVRDGVNLYTSVSLDTIWALGHCTVGAVTFESAAYVARYINKKKLGSSAVYYEQQCIEPEFSRMSRRPGIGSSWFEKFKSDVFPSDNVVIRNGIKTKPPKYYSYLYEKINPIKLLTIKANRIYQMKLKVKDNTKKRLQTKENIKISQISMLQRNL